MTIGVDLGGTNVRAGLVGNDSAISNYRRELFRNKASLDETLSQLIEFIRPLTVLGREGIGIGVPSVVDIARGMVYNVTNIPAWKEVPLKKILEGEFKLPVFINNDVNCFALGEHRHGTLKGFRNVVGVSCGTGLGAGIIINNNLYAGTNCGAGEIGLLSYLDRNIEYYASGNLFRAKYNTTAEEAHNKAVAGDPAAIASWREFSTHIAVALKNVAYAFDPEAIVLGGSLSKAFRLFEAPMRKVMLDFEFPETMRKLKIFQSTNEHITLLGAAALVAS
ncbi:MAG: ROK family protein [Chryseolinea sp.]